MFKFKNLRWLGLIVALIVLYTILNKVIIPFTFDVAKSDLYLDGSEDNGSQFAVSTAMSDLAYKHCNTFIKNELDEDAAPRFASQPIKAWDIGSYTFIVNGEIELQNKDGVSNPKKYVCRIKFEDGDQNDFDNWSVYGVTGLDEI